MKGFFGTEPLREWISFAAAIALGPTFLLIGYQIHGLVFGAAAGAGIIVCAVVVPLLTIAAGRIKFLAWQVAIVSLTLAVLWDNLRLNAIQRGDIASMVYVFWAGGTLLSSPLPIYFLLRWVPARRRYLAAIAIAMVAVAMWTGIRRITR